MLVRGRGVIHLSVIHPHPPFPLFSIFVSFSVLFFVIVVTSQWQKGILLWHLLALIPAVPEYLLILHPISGTLSSSLSHYLPPLSFCKLPLLLQLQLCSWRRQSCVWQSALTFHGPFLPRQTRAGYLWPDVSDSAAHVHETSTSHEHLIELSFIPYSGGVIWVLFNTLFYFCGMTHKPVGSAVLWLSWTENL